MTQMVLTVPEVGLVCVSLPRRLSRNSTGGRRWHNATPHILMYVGVRCQRVYDRPLRMVGREREGRRASLLGPGIHQRYGTFNISHAGCLNY